MAVTTGRPADELVTGRHDNRLGEPGTSGAGDTGSAAAAPVAGRTLFGRARVGNTGARHPKWVVPLALVLLVVLVGASVVAIWFGVKAVQGFSDARGMANAVSAAEDVATDFTSFDVASGDRDTERLLRGTTDRYAAGFSGDKEAYLKNLVAIQGKSTGTATGAGVIDYDPATSTAHVLVTVRAWVSTKDQPAAQPRDYRMELTMIDQSWLPGGWKADAIEFRS